MLSFNMKGYGFVTSVSDSLAGNDSLILCERATIMHGVPSKTGVSDSTVMMKSDTVLYTLKPGMSPYWYFEEKMNTMLNQLGDGFKAK